MPVTSVVLITQITVDSRDGSIRESPLSHGGSFDVRETTASVSSSMTQTHVPAVSNPSPGGSPNWPTRKPAQDYWSDSHILQPGLQNRRRMGYGRDIQEAYEQRARPGQIYLEADSGGGKRWGKLDAVAGVLMYEEEFILGSEAIVLEFHLYNDGSIREHLVPIGIDFSVHELGVVTGEFTVREYPFLLDSLPLPNSIKNPVATDIYIRVGNFSSIFDEDSFVLYIDDVLQSTVEVVPFIGGFDVTWHNSMLFNYDAQVNVRWEFSDTDSPAARFVVSYPFYTVPDLAGPRVTNLVPADEAFGIPIQGTIQFDIEDFEADVNLDTLVIYVNNQKVVSGDTGTLELVRFENKKGYTVKYTPGETWLYGDLIPVAIFAQDTSANSNETFFTYSFTTVESIIPRLINLRPLACTVAVSVGTHISLDIVDGGHGLDKSSITFTVEDIERGGQVALIPIVHRDE